MVDNNTSCIDIPLSCSLFLEPALGRYRTYISPISKECGEYIHEWNAAMTNILRDSKYSDRLGPIAKKLLRKPKNNIHYIPSYIKHAPDARVYALHYAIRFSESVRFLTDKIGTKPDLNFVDFGCGLTPMAAQMQTTYPTTNAYCIDMPYIADIYENTARTVGGGEPKFISWDTARKMATNNAMDAVVAIGLFHYMDTKEQIQNLKFVNKYFPNFMIEIKYKAEDSNTDPNTNAFDLKTLQKLRIDVPHVNTIETTMLGNSMRYLRAYRAALPQCRDFVENVRSLFLSR